MEKENDTEGTEKLGGAGGMKTKRNNVNITQHTSLMTDGQRLMADGYPHVAECKHHAAHIADG